MQQYAWFRTNTHSEKQVKSVGGFYYSFAYLYFFIFFSKNIFIIIKKDKVSRLCFQIFSFRLENCWYKNNFVVWVPEYLMKYLKCGS